jgi:hypothetical protein
MTHITKDKGEARKAEVPETEALRKQFEQFCKEQCSPGAYTSDWYWRIFQAGARAAELSAQQDKRKSPSRERVEIIAAWLRRNGTDQQADAVLALLEDNEALCEAVDKRIAERDEARALSAQESKPVAWEPVGTVDNLSGYVRWKILPGDMSSGTVLYRAATSVSAQDASTKDGWKPIETAPKDDTRVLILDHGIQFIAKWSNEADHGHALVAPGWQIHYCHEDLWYCTATATPTHWQPLPEPPHD